MTRRSACTLRGSFFTRRTEDTIAIYAIDQTKGTLTQKGSVPTGGKEPRNFEIDPTGHFLFAANQLSDNVVIFRIDAKTGNLTATGQVFEVGRPVCIRFLKVN